jgi:hypothetical protein
LTGPDKTADALDAACVFYRRAKLKVDGQHEPDALRRRVESRQAAISRLLKAAEARAAQIEEGPPHGDS